MKITYKFNKLNSMICGAVIIFLGFVSTSIVWAGDSGRVGKNAPNDSQRSFFTLSCKSHERLIGIEVAYWEGIKTTHLKLTCAHYGPNGEWGTRGQSRTEWSNYGNGSSGVSILCPRDTWVGEISAIPDFHYGGINLHCYRGTADGRRTGNQRIASSRNLGGIKRKGSCPNQEIAYAIKGVLYQYTQSIEKFERYPVAPSISNFSLKCKAIGAPLAPPGIAPVLVSPGSLASRQVYPGVTEFHLQHVNNATHYRVRILTDSPSPRSWYDQVLGGALLSSSRGNDRYVKIRIPTNKAGTVARWKAAACNRERRCGPWSAWKTFSILPRPR